MPPTGVVMAGQSRRHGLEQRHRHTFGVRRQHEHIALGEQPIALVRVDPRKHAHTVAEGRGQLAHALDIAIAGQHQPRAGAHRLRQRGKGIHQVIAAFALSETPEVQELHLRPSGAIGTSRGHAHRIRQHHHLRRRYLAFVHVEIAPLRRQRDQHVGLLQRAVHEAAHRRRQTAMKLVEARAMRVQDQRPPRAHHHVRENELAQGAAARREVDVHDGRFDAIRACATASCTARANTAAFASFEPSFMVAT